MSEICHAVIFQSDLLSEINYLAMMETMCRSIFFTNIVDEGISLIQKQDNRSNILMIILSNFRFGNDFGNTFINKFISSLSNFTFERNYAYNYKIYFLCVYMCIFC